MISSYSSPFNLGHKALESFFDGGSIYIQEKVDGSQASVSVAESGELLARSRNQILGVNNGGMFAALIESANNYKHLLTPNYIYRGEYLSSRKHNAIAYSRIPKNHFIIYDIDKGDQDYILPDSDEWQQEFARLGDHLEYVPLLAVVTERDTNYFNSLTTRESVLGGCQIEGVVLKNYRQFANDKKVLMAKLVRADFKEINKKNWGEQNPAKASFIDTLVATYGTPQRWRKAYQHLLEQGLLQQAPQDIPLLIKEVTADTLAECEDEIKDALFAYFWKNNLSRGINRGLAEWYKDLLSKEQSCE
jgi:hypothetical protein